MENIAEIAKKNAHIPDAEIEQDILETEREIETMTAEADHLEKTPLSLPGARMDHMRADARRSGIANRRKFVDDLRELLKYRKGEHGQ